MRARTVPQQRSLQEALQGTLMFNTGPMPILKECFGVSPPLSRYSQVLDCHACGRACRCRAIEKSGGRRVPSRDRRRTRGAGARCHTHTRCAAVLLKRRRTRGAGDAYDVCTRCAAVLLSRDPIRADYSRRITIASAIHHGRKRRLSSYPGAPTPGGISWDL